MSRSKGPSTPRGLRAVTRRLGAITVGTLAIAVPASAAIAASVTHVGTANSSTLNETVVVDPHGRTLYALHPETTHHLLCKSHACFEAWPRFTVPANTKLQAGSGIEGHLGLLRRRDGKMQVTLRGMPLYRFSGDSAKGEANGDGIKSFGGTWHAVKAQVHSTTNAGTPAPTPASPTPPTPTPSPPPPSTPPYGY